MTQTTTLRRWTSPITAVLLALIALVVVTSPAHAALDVTSFTGSVERADGSPAKQAGSHPYSASTRIEFASHVGPGGDLLTDESVRNLTVDLPPGFIGDPTATPRCSEADLNNLKQGGPACPASTQVGVVYLESGFPDGGDNPAAVYNVEPPPGVAAVLGFNIFANLARIEASVRTGGDYGVTMKVKNANQFIGLTGTRLIIWGVPADPSHDPLRFSNRSILGASSDAPRLPFLTNPVDCSAGPLTTSLRADSWQDPGVFDFASFDHDVNGEPMDVAGCDRVPFDPSMTIRTAATQADSPTGLDVDLRLPQNKNSNAIATSSLRKAVVRLPEGVSISPSAADGLAACSPSQIGIDNDLPAACPDASKVGTVEVDTPLLEDPLTGNVFVATQRDNPFGSLFALYIVVEGQGVLVKLAGRVDPDPVTGQLTATFDDNPQLPFSDLRLSFDGGPRASLANAPTCGVKTTGNELLGWSGKAVAGSDSFSVDSGPSGGPCPSGSFAPSFAAGSVSPTGGRESAFTMTMRRPDGDQVVDGLTVDMPQGLTGKVGSVPLCQPAQADAGTCSEASRIGSTTTAAGPGALPFHLPGRVYLTSGYKGAPYGLSVVVPAVAGPFDLGLVVVRAAVHVDRSTAAVKVISDPLPKILEGVPLRLRMVNVLVDRPDFMLNPTDCTATQVKATVTSVQGAQAKVADRFQAAECAALPFKPRLSLALSGRKQIRTGKHPGVNAVVRQKGIGEAGIDKAKVTLPKSLALDPDNAQALCEFADGTKPDLENHCPKGSIVGRAKAVTPLLGKPLAGNVYFVKNVRRSKSGNLIRTLPMLVVALRGEIAINLKGESSTTRDGRLVNTFASVPDAPISQFNLNINGGNNGILAVTRTRKAKINLCNGKQVAETDMAGHNGKRHDFDVRIKTPCAKEAAKPKSKKR